MPDYFIPIVHCKKCRTLYSPPIKMNIQQPSKWDNGKLITHCRNKSCKYVNKNFDSNLEYLFEPILNGILNIKKPYGSLETLHYNLNKLTPPFNIIEIQREVEKVLGDVDMPGYMLKLDLSPGQMMTLTLLMSANAITTLKYLDKYNDELLSKTTIKLQIIQQMVDQNIFIKAE